MKRINCAVIGLGWFGEHHVDTFNLPASGPP
jgi:predicted dehydrogenase